MVINIKRLKIAVRRKIKNFGVNIGEKSGGRKDTF
jgi:hypothetical protein